jgi:hypothetical protein
MNFEEIGSASDSSSSSSLLEISSEIEYAETTISQRNQPLRLADEAIFETQMGKSACGPTAVKNILLTLKCIHGDKRNSSSNSPAKSTTDGCGSSLRYVPIRVPADSTIMSIIPARQRDYDTSSLVDYIISRAKAGTTHIDLVQGINILCGEIFPENQQEIDISPATTPSVDENVPLSIKHRFFSFDPRLDNPKDYFLNWLGYWMSKGCVPLLTENLFIIGNDALHHQTVYGIDGEYLLLTNPVDRVHVDIVYNWISSPGFLIIPEDHILSRCSYLTSK